MSLKLGFAMSSILLRGHSTCVTPKPNDIMSRWRVESNHH